MQLDVIGVSMPLKKRFAVSKGGTDIKTNLLAVLDNRYVGEAAGSVYYGPSVADLRADLSRGMEWLRGEHNVDAATLEAIAQLEIHAAARSALTAMVLNYVSGQTRRYPWEIMSLGSPVGIKSSWTVSVDKPAVMIEEIKNSPYPIIKVKMGHEDDIMLLDALSEIKNKEIRVDANGGWSCAKAEEMIHHLSVGGVKVIEQPTDAEFVREWPHLKSKDSGVELVMDEGLNSLKDYRQYSQYIDAINIKPEKCGGIVEGSKLAAAAREDGKKVMLGCMVASSVGIAQSVYMSSTADYFDLDGPLLLQDDIARGIRYDRESIEVDREIIGGPKLIRDVLEKYITE
jgi:L-alanine-DL-glutamate epimerase-like enolase superfamily enzyme